LVLLTFPVTLAQLAAAAMKDDAGELVTAFAAVKLDEDAATIPDVLLPDQLLVPLAAWAWFIQRRERLLFRCTAP
jgi:hypothetical protein